MKKISFIIASFLLIGIQEGFCQSPFDMAYHAIPTSPAIEIKSEVISVGKQGVQVAKGVQTGYTEAQTAKNNLQTAITSTFNNIASGAILGLNGNADGSATFYGKKLTKVKLEKVIKKFKKLLITYDSRHDDDVKFVDGMRDNFYLDNVYAINAAAAVLHKELTEEMAAKIKIAKECAKGDGGLCGIPASSDGGKNEVWYTYGETLSQYDRLVKMWETVAALRARLTAVKTLRAIYPSLATDSEKADDEKNDGTEEETGTSETPAAETSALQLTIPAVFTSRHTETLAFAQVSYNKTAATIAAVEAKVTSAKAANIKKVKMPIDFVSPDEPDTESPMIANEAKLDALNDMRNVQGTVDKASDVHNMLDNVRHYKETAEEFHEMEKKYEQKVAKLVAAEQCALKFIGGYFKSPTATWSGIKLGKNANRHDLRKGISGWAVEAFETAKAAETNSVETADIESFSLEDGAEDAVSDDPDMTLAGKEVKKIDAELSPSKLNQAQDEMRKTALLPWQIGAEATKMLGEDSQKWGKRTTKSMIWTDSKRFYQQYLQRKYDNIKSYLKRYTKDDVLAVVIAKLKNDKKDITETNYQKKLLEAELQSGQEQADSIEKMRVSMQEYDAGTKSELEALIKQRKGVVKQVDNAEAAVRQDSTSVTDMRTVAEEKAASKTDEVLNAEVTFPEDENKASSLISAINSVASVTSAVHATNTQTLDSGSLSSLQSKIASNKALRTSGNKKIEELDKKIAKVKAVAQAKRASTNKLSSIVNSIKEKLSATKQTTAASFSSDVSKNITSVIPRAGLMMSIITSEAEKAVERLNEEVDAVVDSAYAQMLALGDKLYTGEAHEQVVAIHNNMVKQIKAIKLAFNVSGVIKISDMLVYAKLLAADLEPEEEGFFVGSMPKSRDMKAPYKMTAFEAPPVREIFHFDVSDFNTIKPHNESADSRALTASEFLNFGGDIPAIWQHILKEKAFIESEYDLKQALSSGCEDTAFSRGGFMPCVIDGTSIVMDVNKDGKYIKRTSAEELKGINVASLPRCYLVNVKKGKPHHVLIDADVVFDKTTVFKPLGGSFFGNGPKEPWYDSIDCEYSELGMLLEADEDNNLNFRERAYNAYTKLQNAKSNTRNLSNKEKDELAAASHAMLDKNQIGDFLRHVENEQESKKNLDELREDYEEQMKQLKEKLVSFGFTPSADFDISKESDYKAVMDKLKSVRKEQSNAAQSAISAIETKDNEPAIELKKSMAQMLSLIKKDENGLVQVDSVSAERSDTDAQVKKATADSAVVDKLKNSLKEKEKEYTDVEEVFCGNYQ